MKLFLAVLLGILYLEGAAQDSITVQGVLVGQGNQRVSISLMGEDGKPVNYSATAMDNSFRVKIKKLPVVTTARLSSYAIKPLTKSENGHNYSSPAPPLDLFIYQSDLTIKGEVDFLHLAIVKGDRENELYSKLKKETEKNDRNDWELRAKMFFLDAGDSAMRKSILDEVMALSKKRTADQKKFIENNPGAFASLFLLSRMENMYTTGDYEQAFAGLTDEFKQTALAQRISQRIAYLSPTSPGKPAVLFSRNDKDGKMIRLSDFKGKLVLIDFWGSWCGPCRASHPHLKELYSKYHEKGFEIIAIADEKAKTPAEQREKWLEAIKKDGIPWVHILNNEGMDKQDLVKEYRVTAFPTKLLVDKNGNILLRITASATNDLEKALEKEYGF